MEQVLAQLTTDQIRFVVARQECSSDKEAAHMIGMSESTIYRWPATVKQAVTLMVNDGIKTALHVRRRALAKAMLVKVRGLDSSDERVRQSAATEVIEWEMGKAVQRNQNMESGEIVIRVKRDSDRYNPARAASRATEDTE